MTVENCIKLLEAYKKQAENPVNGVGRPYEGAQRSHAKQQSQKNYEMMKKHILNSRKFKDNPILKELQGVEVKPKEKKDGKKSKR